jgi:mono/diheme cytochrome c family protein
VSILADVSAGKAILIGIASAAAVLIVVGASIAALRRPRRGGGPDIPPAMRPGPSDADLEEPLRTKLYAWGMVFVVIMAITIPVIFLRENVTNANDTRDLLAQSVERGKLTTLPGTEVNQIGFNCQRCHGPGLHGGLNIYNGEVVKVPNLQTVCGGAKYGHPQINGLDDIINTISQGRANTDMPSWSVRYAGAMDDQQINDLVNYILSVQKIPAKDNICLNPPKA